MLPWFSIYLNIKNSLPQATINEVSLLTEHYKLPSTKIHFPNLQNYNVGLICQNPAIALQDINFHEDPIHAFTEITSRKQKRKSENTTIQTYN